MSENTVKSPFKAALYCLLLGAGAGQIYNGQKRKGIVMMILFLAPVCYLTYLIMLTYSKYWQRASAGDLSAVVEFIYDVRNNEAISGNSSFAGILWLISIVDGYVSARLINKKMNHDLMTGFFIHLEEPVFRPPREHDALIIQATTGCSRNSCLFCAMYKGKKFRIKKPAEIEAEAAGIPAPLRSGVHKIFLADANAFCLKSEDLLEMAAILKKYFVNNRFISIYASPLDIIEKSEGELEALRKAGYKNLYVGLESGSDKVLGLMNKPGSFEESRLAMKKAHDGGFVLSVTLLLGLGGKKYTKEHSEESARLINECQPKFVNTLTTTLYEAAPLYKMARSGEFEMLTNYGIIDEHYNFIDNLNVNRVIYRSNHVSNFIGLEGVLSKDKENLLAGLLQFKQSCVSDNFINLKTGGNYEI